MEYKFETFDEKPFYRTGSEAHVSIYSQGSIYLNKRALELLGDPDAVALMYDPENSVIGIQATPPSRHHAFRLRRKANRGHGCTLRAKSFFRRFQIETDAAPPPPLGLSKTGGIAAKILACHPAKQSFAARRLGKALRLKF